MSVKTSATGLCRNTGECKEANEPKAMLPAVMTQHTSDVLGCTLLGGSWWCEWKCCLRLQGLPLGHHITHIYTVLLSPIGSLRTPVPILPFSFQFNILPWRWTQHVTPKLEYLPIRLHREITQKTTITAENLFIFVFIIEFTCRNIFRRTCSRE